MEATDTKASICIATFNKYTIVSRVLDSIYAQSPPFLFETIVVDDGSTDRTNTLQNHFPQIVYIYNGADTSYRNPATPRNIAYKHARGDVLIPQSDDVVHLATNTIERLTLELKPKTFSIAHVRNTDMDGRDKPIGRTVMLTGRDNRRPFFFLGAVRRSDMCRAGGNDERYTVMCRDDAALADALITGVGLQPRYVDVRGNHIDHGRPANYSTSVGPSYRLYQQLLTRKQKGVEPWTSPGAPWPYEPQEPVVSCT